MTDTLVDTNVILDVNGPETQWQAWSFRRLADAGDEGDLVISPIVYAELAAGYARREDIDDLLDRTRVVREDLPWDAAYFAGRVYLDYRKRGGTRTSPLPDFFIGAHAVVRGYRLLTRDRGYYRAYFPALEIISPESLP